jgi:Protein of unknown function (DUF2510)
MTVAANPVGFLGRALAAFGALIWIAALFMDLYSGFDSSKWDIYRRVDVISLLLAAAAVLLLIVSVAVAEQLLLFVVGAIGGWLLSFGVADLVESRGPDIAVGGYSAVLGAGLVTAGAAVALIPALGARPGDEQQLAFLPAEAETSPAAPAAGWYPDPTGQASLRYWDGQAWGEQTQQ